MISITDSKIEPWRDICQKLLFTSGIVINGDRPFDIQVKDTRFYRRVLQQGSLGLGESYMDGWWDCEKLDEFMERILRADLESCLKSNLKDVIRLASAKLINHQSRKKAKIVGREHYDLGNDFFSHILDPYMQYSCGYWKNASDLYSAQQNKLRLICDKLQLSKGMTLLDIGCGWGGLASYAAENYGVKVTGVTISEEQRKLASQNCASFDINIRLQDYRDISETFDRIVSVGMFEHVGPKNYKTYFNVVNKALKDDGLFLLHTIGSNKTALNVDPWINKYIFPNGYLPSIAQIAAASESLFVLEDLHNFGADYDLTLMEWSKRFDLTWHQINDNYSPRFYRMFKYYLNACAGAFRARKTQLWQFVFSRGIPGGLRVTR